jgi:hypothetical protein
VSFFLSFAKGAICLSRSYAYLLPPIVLLMIWWVATLQLVWFLTSSIVFVVSIIIYTHASNREQSQREAERTKQLLARIRHDQMNHIQVLMGYQTLQKPEKISEYLKKLSIIASSEQDIANFKSCELAVFLLTLPNRYPQWRWDVQKPDTYVELPDKISSQVVQWIIASMKLLVKIGKKQHDWQQISLKLTGNSKSNIISIRVLDTGGNPINLNVPAREWINLKNKLTRAHVELDLVDQQQLTLRILVSR